MIPDIIRLGVTAFQGAVTSARPIAERTPLQLAALVAQGQALVQALDVAEDAAGVPLDAADPSGHPLAMIATVRSRVAAASDQAALSDTRGFVARAVLNLSRGFV